MRILIKALDNTETVLCDGPGRGTNKNHGPLNDGLVIDDNVVAQVAEFLRASAAKAFNRKNQQTRVAFRIARECDSIIAAHSWQLAFHAGCIRSGTIHLIEVDANGTEKRVKIPDAVITAIKTTPLGVTRIVEFSITGGPLTE